MRGGTGIDTLPTRHTGMELRTQTRALTQALTRCTRAGMRTVRAERANCVCRTVRRSYSDHKSAARTPGRCLGCARWFTVHAAPLSCSQHARSRRQPSKARAQTPAAHTRQRSRWQNSLRQSSSLARGRRGYQRRQRPSQLLAAHEPRASGRLGPPRSSFCSLGSAHASAHADWRDEMTQHGASSGLQRFK